MTTLQLLGNLLLFTAVMLVVAYWLLPLRIDHLTKNDELLKRFYKPPFNFIFRRT